MHMHMHMHTHIHTYTGVIMDTTAAVARVSETADALRRHRHDPFTSDGWLSIRHLREAACAAISAYADIACESVMTHTRNVGRWLVVVTEWRRAYSGAPIIHRDHYYDGVGWTTRPYWSGPCAGPAQWR